MAKNKHQNQTRYHLVVQNAASGYILKDIITDDQSELCYSFDLFDRTKYLGFSKQAATLTSARSGLSVTESYKIYNTFRKFGKTMDECFEFDVTISKLLED